ncbi:SRA stem-loop-interacting RNA-binding protein, mitochondrial-like [Ctenocephalides felis]|uniref:SRA stem-loop-interacting RNA-binding protein, mitochondrial-like n=1 Tax=Ctenocephalides felis TaxID=7515 RepID=UPI000E6E57FC|nr:SRA stem-loop-interacting RNA-binding protein, mitochondrial-like [Ctenocephalides felis]
MTVSQVIRSANKLFVGNIPWTVSHRELKKHFAEFGHISSASVVFDKASGISKGFGFVQFSAKGGIQNALNKQVHNLEGNVLNIKAV